MAGGTWSPTDLPVLPGFYNNFRAAALASIQPGARGVVIAAVKAHWGPIRQFVEITSESGITDYFTNDESNGATARTTIRLALLGKPQKVLAYRLASPSAAKATLTLNDGASTNLVKLDAYYEGERGNKFKATVAVNPIDGNKKDLKLYENTTLLRIFTFDGTAQNLVDVVNADSNPIKYLTASKLADGNVEDVTNQSFSGGDSGIAGVVNADYTDALEVFETQQFNGLTLDGVTDPALHTSVVSWVDRVRSEGKGIIVALGGSSTDDKAADAVNKATARSAGFNHEGVINVGCGVKLDGVEYSSAQAAAYAIALAVGQKLSESTTYAATPFEDVNRRWTRSEQETAVKNGVFLFIHDGRIVKVLKGINSLITLRQGQNNAWKKIRSIRVMDAINQDFLLTAESAYIGKVNNTEEGRLALIGAGLEYMATLAAAGVIEPGSYSIVQHPDYYGKTATITPEPDQVYLQWSAKLTDVMEQIFGDFAVQ